MNHSFFKFSFDRIYIAVFILLGLLKCPLIQAQTSQVEWIVGHDQIQGSREDFPKCGLATTQGEFVSAGVTGNQLIVIKIGGEGKTKWVSRIGGKFDEYGATSIEETTQGHLLIGGFHGKYKFQERVLLKLNATSGNLIWIKHYPNDGFGAIEGVEEVNNGDIIMTGYVNGAQENGFLSMESEAIIMKTDSIGELLWMKKLIDKDNGIKIPSGMRILEDKFNGGYIISSTVFKEGNTNMDFCLLKTDTAGQILWVYAYGGDKDEHCYDMDLTLDGGYIMTGHTSSPPSVGWDAYLIKVDKNGLMVWEKRFGEPLNGDPRKIFDECYGVRSTSDGGYIMSCGTGIEPGFFEGSSYWDSWRILAIKTDSLGNFVWDFTSRDIEGEKAGEYIENTLDGAYMIFVDAGNTEYLKLSEPIAESKEIFELTTSSQGQGYINPSKRYYRQQSEIIITAYPDEGYEFSSWSGDLSGSKNPVKLTMDSAKRIQAKFSKVVTNRSN